MENAESKSDFIKAITSFKKHGIEIWNHGYEAAHSEHEFCGSTYNEQVHSIERTQMLMEKYLGRRAVTFGSPHNNSTELTVSVLNDNFPEIVNYLYIADGMRRTKANTILLRCNYEFKTGVPDFDLFMRNYNRMKSYPYMMLQGHPGFWTETGFKIHERILKELRDQNNEFIVPSDFAKFKRVGANVTDVEHIINSFSSFVNSHEHLVLYGSGEIGREVFNYMSMIGRKPDLFAVSDGQNIVSDTVCDIPVMHFSEVITKFKNTSMGIILTLLSGIHNKVMPVIIDSGYDYWNAGVTISHDRFVDYVRYTIAR